MYAAAAALWTAQLSPSSAAAIPAAAWAAQAATEPVRTPIMQNDTVAVTRLRFGPGTREVTHSHPFPLLIVQVTAGEMSVQEQNVVRRGSRPGEVWYVPPERPHAVTMMGTAGEVEMVAIALLPARPPAPAAPPTDAPAGITRATLVDNGNVRVVRVRFAPAAREPLHSHPNDLLTVQITRGVVEIVNGSDRTTGEREPGLVQFLPRNVPHAFISADTATFELLSIGVK